MSLQEDFLFRQARDVAKGEQRETFHDIRVQAEQRINILYFLSRSTPKKIKSRTIRREDTPIKRPSNFEGLLIGVSHNISLR